MKVDFKRQKPYIAQSKDDSFMCAFNSNLSLRLSCYHCHYAGNERVSDITIADFWGMDDPEIVREAQGKGISAVFVNTDNGMDLFEEVSGKCVVYERTYEEAARRNHVLTAPMPYNPKRKYFFKHLGEVPFHKLVLNATRSLRFKTWIKDFSTRAKNKVLRCIRRK